MASKRVPAGVREGGQFATAAKPEQPVTLTGATSTWRESPEDPEVSWFEESGLLAQVVTTSRQVDRSGDYDLPPTVTAVEWDVTTDDGDTVLASGAASSERTARQTAVDALRAAARDRTR